LYEFLFVFGLPCVREVGYEGVNVGVICTHGLGELDIEDVVDVCVCVRGGVGCGVGCVLRVGELDGDAMDIGLSMA